MPKSKSSKLIEEKFVSRYLIDRLPDAVFGIAADARFIYFNDAACRQFEYSREELLFMKLPDLDLDFSQETWLERWQSFKHPNSFLVKSQYQTKSRKLLSVELTFVYVGEKDARCCYAFIRKAEEIEPGYQLSQPSQTKFGKAAEPNENGTASAITNVERDKQSVGDEDINNLYQEISQLKEAEAQLTETLSLMRGTLDSAAYGIIAVSYKGEVISHNQKFMEMWQIPDSLTLSKDSEECRNFFARQLENPEVFRRSVWEVSRESDAETYDVLKLKDGRVFAQYSKPQRLYNKIIGRVWSICDITKLEQQTESEIQKTQSKTEAIQAIEEAKYLSELRSRFLSMLCHQFRSSLNVISFSNSLLKRYAKWTDDKKLPYLDNIQTAVEQIGELLNELVFFGKSEVGQIELKSEPIDLTDFCRKLAAQIKPLCDDKQQVIKFNSSFGCKTIYVDKNILHHILSNLLSNAIKYSPIGSTIQFEVFYQPEQAVIKIEDRGIGISTIDRQQIFEPFFRGGNVDDIPGNGLGLSIVKNLVEVQGGKIEVESEVGMGTTFLLFLAVESQEDT